MELYERRIVLHLNEMVFLRCSGMFPESCIFQCSTIEWKLWDYFLSGHLRSENKWGTMSEVVRIGLTKRWKKVAVSRTFVSDSRTHDVRWESRLRKPESRRRNIECLPNGRCACAKWSLGLWRRLTFPDELVKSQSSVVRILPGDGRSVVPEDWRNSRNVLRGTRPRIRGGTKMLILPEIKDESAQHQIDEKCVREAVYRRGRGNRCGNGYTEDSCHIVRASVRPGEMSDGRYD